METEWPKSQEHPNLRSEPVQAILSQIPHVLIRWGNLAILALIFLALTFTWFIKYPDVVSGKATISSAIPPQKEYAAKAGKLSALLVDDGDTVASGQLLGVIENSADFNDVFLLKSLLNAMDLQSYDIYFPLDSFRMLQLGELSANYSVFENSYLRYRASQDLSLYPYEVAISEYRKRELQNRLQYLKRQLELNSAEQAYGEKVLNRRKLLHQQGAISDQDLEIDQKQFLQTRRASENLAIEISRMMETIAMEDKNMQTVTTEEAKNEWLIKRSLFQAYGNLHSAIADWELKYTLRSDIYGKVAFGQKRYQGQQVNTGELVFEIIPLNHQYFIAHIEAPPRNYGKVRPGQKVLIKLEDYPEKEFGVLEAIVTRTPQLSSEAGFYLIEAQLPDVLTTSYGRQVDYHINMKGKAQIITEDLRLSERLLNQLKAQTSLN